MLTFHVQGSASKPYRITAEGIGESLAIYCTCPAGARSAYFCKHAAALLLGDVTNLRDPSDDLALLAARSAGSPLLQRAIEHQPSERRSSIDVSDIEAIHTLASTALAGSGFEIISSGTAGDDDRRVAIHQRLKNGKPQRRAALMFKYSRLTAQQYDSDGEPMPRFPSTRPWHVVVANRPARTFSLIGNAASAFVDEMGKLGS